MGDVSFFERLAQAGDSDAGAFDAFMHTVAQNRDSLHTGMSILIFR